MDRLLRELTERAVLDTVMVDWARAHHPRGDRDLDAALLELDLVDEDDLAAGLEAAFAVAPARPADLDAADPALADRLDDGASRSLALCPLRLDDDGLVVLVEQPLADATIEQLRVRFGADVHQRIGTASHLAIARHAIYGAPLDERTRALADRLARRRRADVRDTLERLQLADSLGAAADAVLERAHQLLEFACFLVAGDGTLQLVAAPDVQRSARPVLPEPACTFAAAIRHGGYFLGPVRGSDEDRRFCASLGRGVPQWAFVAPVPASAGAAVFYADNGPRGIAKRWVAELTLLVARVAQQRGSWQQLAAAPAAPPDVPAAEPAAPVEMAPEPSLPLEAPAEDETTMLPLTRAEITALYRLQREADNAGISIDALVDRLLEGGAPAAAPAAAPTAPAAAPTAPAAAPTAPATAPTAPATAPAPTAPAPDNAALSREVRDLFDRLATDIPAQLARGMESAFRDLVPRLAGGRPASPASPPAAPAAAADVELVQKSDAPREVASYRSRRRKAKRIKL